MSHSGRVNGKEWGLIRVDKLLESVTINESVFRISESDSFSH